MCCHDLSRRDFVTLTAAGTVAPANAAEWPADWWDPERPFARMGQPLRVQPVLMYTLPKRKAQTSWKSWGGIQTEANVAEVVWTGVDEDGNQLANGAYIFILAATDGTNTFNPSNTESAKGIVFVNR